MAQVHIAADLQNALRLYGIGADSDWECIGKAVDECGKEAVAKEGWEPAFVQGLGEWTRWLTGVNGPVQWRDTIRDQAKQFRERLVNDKPKVGRSVEFENNKTPDPKQPVK